ncbi:sensor domain-containing diguanylate cyclase [Methylorubrum extorquens]|uniref:sensor domain-containing diguanylate cyclase n=1 Tax=Methylorubrum extorquens TaxID=408 RepID=UPI002236FBEA|nr:sensor domain-containing diguanylate cyclase [Methylorubrum extorquens]UYW24858.1 sensor domain-containing diguanylate cyclase [Methylorubrum extorquens]
MVSRSGFRGHLWWTRSPWLLAALNLLCVVGLCAVSAFMLWDMRRDAERRATAAAQSLVQVLSRDIARNIGMYDLSLRAIVDGWRLPAVRNADPETRQLILFDRAANAENFGHTLVFDRSGTLIISSKSLNPEPLSYADREYFQYHATHKDLGLHVSAPIVSRLTGRWALIISRRLSNPDGSFAGVVLGSIYLDYFRQLFAAIDPDHAGTVTLYGPGGTIVMREPFDEQLVGRSVSATDSYQRMLQTRQGVFTGPAMIGEGARTFAVAQVGELPLQLSIALTAEDIYAAWWQKALVLAAVVLSLCTTTVVLTTLFRRELTRRKAAQRATAALNAELQQLASTDALTGLGNRRRFDEVLERECLRATRTGKALSLLILDADHFKGFNDRYGHQQGDEALRLIARSAQGSIHAYSDTAYRIGGEEFAVILPDTEEPSAEAVANRIRQAVLVQAVPHASNPHGLVTVSCGVAVTSTIRNCSPVTLIAAADAALYEAKRRGRNQVRTTAAERPLSVIDGGR